MDRSSARFHRASQVALPPEMAAPISVRFCEVWMQRDPAFQQFRCAVVVVKPLQRRGDTEQMRSIRMRRLKSQNFPVACLRGAQIPGGMVRNTSRQYFGDAPGVACGWFGHEAEHGIAAPARRSIKRSMQWIKKFSVRFLKCSIG